MPHSRLFFDTIPVEVLFILVQYLSDLPHSERWSKNVNISDATTVLTAGGALSVAGRERFKSLEPRRDFKLTTPFEYRSIALVMASHLERLHVHPYSNLKWDQFPSLRVLLLFQCKRLNMLTQIFTTCGRDLRELRVGSMPLEQSSIETIARECRSLAVLKLCNVEYFGTLEKIYRSIGNTLRELHGNICEEDFVHVGRHCKRLEKLVLSEFRGMWASSETKELLRSLPILQFVRIDLDDLDGGPTPENVHRIRDLLAVCPPNLRVASALRYGHSDECVDFIKVFSHRLRVLSLSCEFGSFPNAVLPHLANVEELTLNSSTNQVEDLNNMESIFVQLMPNLRKLEITPLNGPRMLPVLARSLTSLHAFNCCLTSELVTEVEQISVKAAHFAEFLNANKQLEQIKVRFRTLGHRNGVREAMSDEVANFIRYLRVCTSLREVEIEVYGDLTGERSQKIRNACVPLRVRRVNLTVNRVPFLPSPGKVETSRSMFWTY